jgi:hypothetical protein
MKFFGRLGLACWLTALVSGMATLGMKIASGVDMTGNPLLGLAILSTMVGVQFFSLGLLGEVHARVYYATQTNQNYAIRELINFAPLPEAKEPPGLKIAA